jgi:hypothetical protein
MIKTFKYRCYPNRGTRRRAVRAFRVFGDIWSTAVNERTDAYFAWRRAVDKEIGKIEKKGKELTKKQQKAIEKQMREKYPRPSFYGQYRLIRKGDHPEFGSYDAHSMENVLHKVDWSYKSWVSKRKNGNPEAIPPRQKKYHRCIAYRDSGWQREGVNLYLRGIGKFRLRLHRPIEGVVKMVTVTEKNGKWYASFTSEI